ncbi:MAG: type I restriction enzyme HsdR N-terminal domain-containing protein [Bacteroidales bacterium]|nr:type I restriction enzyme HsdR N-terminal domain-containing protein [Bacteroidales bacterium]
MMNNNIYCLIRRKYVAHTPEEEVRQHTVYILNKQYHYPLTRFSVEAQIQVGKTNKRYDIVVRDNNLQPFMLVECKAPNVDITEKTLSQALAYNINLDANYILLTNSIVTVIFRKTKTGYKQQKTIPILK